MEVRGNEKDLGEFLKMLNEKNVLYTIPYRGSTESNESYRSMRIFVHVLESVIVEFSKKSVEAIINWLKDRKKKGLKNPNLKIIVEGNILDLNPKDMKTLADILKKASKEKPKKGMRHNRKRAS